MDYRALNAVTIADAYLMPLVSDITRAVRGKKVFSKIDLSQGFNQLTIDESSRPYTTFPGPRGQAYEFCASPFGLRNIPSAFQRMMDKVLGSMLWERASVYIDDIIVFSDTVDQHHKDLAELAGRLSAARIVVKASKCVFYRAEVEYVGYFLNGTGLRVMPDRVAGVLNVSVPTNRKELGRFLGLTNQFRHLIYRYAEISRHMDVFRHKNSHAQFDMSVGSEGHKSFLKLREALINADACDSDHAATVSCLRRCV